MIRKMVILLLVSVIVTTVTFAQSRQNDYFNRRWYVSSAIGLNTLWGDGYSPIVNKNGETNVFNTAGLLTHIGIGYDLSPVFALRAIGGYTHHIWSDFRKHNQHVSFSVSHFAVDAVVNLSNWWSGYGSDRQIDFEAFGGLGIYNRLNKNDFASSRVGPLARFGVGGNLHLSSCFDLNLGLEGNFTDDHFDSYASDIPFDMYWGFTVGITYHFGSLNGLINGR
jgi:hypothetical protein